MTTWRAKDKHTGIGKHRSSYYTYRHVETKPTPPSTHYRIETYIPFVLPTPIHNNVYYVEAHQLEKFFEHWHEHAETIIDIRPITSEQATTELEQFKLEYSP